MKEKLKMVMKAMMHDESNTDPDNASDIADDQVVADEIVDDTSDDLEEGEDDEAIMMPFSEDATDHEPVFRCDFCKDLEDELQQPRNIVNILNWSIKS